MEEDIIDRMNVKLGEQFSIGYDTSAALYFRMFYECIMEEIEKPDIHPYEL